MTKRTLDRAARDLIRLYDNGNSIVRAIEALREAIAGPEGKASAERARRSYERRLTPEQRQAAIERAEARAARLRALEGE